MSTTLCRGSGGRGTITIPLLSINYTRLLGHKDFLIPPVIHKPVPYYFELVNKYHTPGRSGPLPLNTRVSVVPISPPYDAFP